MKSYRVIGGGISGLSSAIQLASDGYPVQVFEKRNQIGEIQGNDAQAIRNYNLPYDALEHFKERGVDFQWIKPITQIQKFSPSGKMMKVYSDDGPLFYVFKRGLSSNSIDQQLYQIATDIGVKFSFNEKKNIRDGDIIAIQSVYRNIWAYGAVFNNLKVDPETILFFLDNRYCPGGYIYALPYGEHELSIAATSYDVTAPLPLLFSKFIKENKQMKKLLKSSHIINKFSGYAYSNVPETAQLNGKKFVGAAAGFVDAARGFGVKNAILSGLFAAESITQDIDYDKAWKKEFGEELLTSLKRRLILEKATNEDYEDLIVTGELSIKKYDKFPPSFKKLLLKLEFQKELAAWRKRYSLRKIFD